MNRVIDPDRFDRWQIDLLNGMMLSIKEQLESDVPSEKVRALTEHIAFRVACIIDGSHVVKSGSEKLNPILGFGLQDSQDEITSVVTGHHPGSFMHEYTYDVSAEIFGEPLP